MWATDRQRGATAAEFALCAVVFFSALFFIIEMARALYLLHTLQEATRRAAAAAAVSDFSDPAVMAHIRQAAVLRDTAGTLLMGEPVTDAHIRIDYLSLTRAASGSMSMTEMPAASLPACPARARIQCAANPYGASCIRFVRVRVCAPDGADCGKVNYQPLFPLTGLSFPLPQAITIAKAEALGFQPGSALCP
ncbi:pilus assembly protein [Duganella sp. FT109W]|uniref:Pilus assembly protein n=1 Tax=Duganella margarita TaxID=2692170 RepID=A0A7X4H7L3_9BURK|nr:TadE/TadG family type IV pilus assembly protein [Duganella margarita]MYM76039.1 pilus assembly protein [Duganella margarita]MYN38935.1 pilus assembly protein [Duganella margarita]